MATALIRAIEQAAMLPKIREHSLVITKLEEAWMWYENAKQKEVFRMQAELAKGDTRGL